MFKFVFVFAACLAYASAGVLHQTALAAPVSALAYANAPLYAAGGSSQVDVRHNYDGTLSSYTTAPFGYAGPHSSRYVAGAPATFAAPAAYASPEVYANAPAAFAAPANYVAPAAYAAPAGVATPFAAQYSTPYAAHYASPYAANFASPYSAHYASPYSAFAHGAGQVVV